MKKYVITEVQLEQAIRAAHEASWASNMYNMYEDAKEYEEIAKDLESVTEFCGTDDKLSKIEEKLDYILSYIKTQEYIARCYYAEDKQEEEE